MAVAMYDAQPVTRNTQGRVMSNVTLLLGKMPSSDGGEEEVAAGWGSIMAGKYQFEKLVFFGRLSLEVSLALLSYWIWYLNLRG